MTKPLTLQRNLRETLRQRVIAECGRMCERAMTYADRNTRMGQDCNVRNWRERAEWWSAKAFREARA